MLMIISIFILPFLSMGIGGHALLVFVLQVRSLINFSKNFAHICLFHQKR